MTEVIPGILESNFSSIVEKIRLIEGFVKWAQIDILDGTLFASTSFHDPSAFVNLRTPLNLELHMMVINPEQLIEDWANVGFKRFIGHIEGMTDTERFIVKVRSKRLEVGLAVDIDTDVAILEPYLSNIDVVLLMAVPAGKSGQSFQEKIVTKIIKLRSLNTEVPIEIDGGINLENARKVIQAGANRLVSTSYIFNSPLIPQAVKKLQSVSITSDGS